MTRAYEATRGIAHEQLTRGCPRREAAGDDYCASHVLIVVCNGVAGVQARPDLERPIGMPRVVRLDLLKDRDGAVEGRYRRLEHNVKGVALGLDLGPARPRDLLADDRSVVAQQAAGGDIAICLDVAGVFAEVGEEKHSGDPSFGRITLSRDAWHRAILGSVHGALTIWLVPLYMDVHYKVDGLTASAVIDANRRDIAASGRHGVRWLNYWFDETTGRLFCLSDAPSAAAEEACHREAHGLMADEISEVSEYGPESVDAHVGPLCMDMHFRVDGLTPQQIADAVQFHIDTGKKHGVHWLKAWYDKQTGRLFCLSQSPSPEAHAAVHGEAGLFVDEITVVTDGASASAVARSAQLAEGR
jgi:hypothetical protein